MPKNKGINRQNGEIPSIVWTGDTGDTPQFNAHAMNNLTFLDYYYKLKNIAISMFEWQNLPYTVDGRFIELCLIERGVCLFFVDDIIGPLVTQCTWGAPLNVYNIPTKRMAIANNGYHMPLNASNSIFIFNNFLHTPMLDMITLYAQRLAEIERSIDVNVKAQKTPVMLSAEESTVLSMKNMYAQYTGNEPLILKNKSVDPSAFQVLKTEAPFVADKLNFLKRQYWNEAIGFFGVENTGFEKREQVQSQEVLSSLGGVMASRYVMLNARRQAADEINRKFGLNIEVNFRQPLSIFNPDMDVTTAETPYPGMDRTTQLPDEPAREDIL